MITVKICGIQTSSDAKCALAAGADFIGLNFVRNSKRNVDFDSTKRIVEEVRRNSTHDVKIVGIFQNHSYEYVNMLAENIDLDYVQLHGDECQSYIALINKPVIKTVALISDFEAESVIKKMQQYAADYYLLDRKNQGKGEVLNLKKVKKICKLYPIFLAGGLTPENVGEVVRIVHPFGVDVAGGVETKGRIECEKVYKFMKQVKHNN